MWFWHVLHMFYQNTHWNRSRTDFLHMYVHCILMNCNKYIIKQTLACIRNIWLTSKYYRQQHLISRSFAILFLSLGTNTHAWTGISAILRIKYDVIKFVRRASPLRETHNFVYFLCVFAIYLLKLKELASTIPFIFENLIQQTYINRLWRPRRSEYWP